MSDSFVRDVTALVDAFVADVVAAVVAETSAAVNKACGVRRQPARARTATPVVAVVAPIASPPPPCQLPSPPRRREYVSPFLPPPGWTPELDRREELLALSEITLNRKCG